MPRFGGIPVEGAKTKPRFAGVPVEDGQAAEKEVRLPGILGTINDFGNDMGDAFVHHLANLPLGAAQMVSHGLVDRATAGAPSGQMEADTGLGSTVRNLARKESNGLHSAVGKLDQWIAQREADYQSKVPDSAGSYTGAAIGEVLPWMTGAGGAQGVLPKAYGFIAKTGKAALEGAGMGSVQPVTDGDYERGKLAHVASGAIAAPILHGALGIVAAPFAGKAKLPASDRAAADVILNQAENPAALNRAAPSQVPGVQRDLAEETLDPGIARLSRNLRSTNKMFDTIDRVNNAKRVSALEGIAGTDAQYRAAEDLRDKVTSQLRNAAFNEGARGEASRAQENVMRRAVAHGSRVASSKGPLEAHIQAIADANKGRPSVLSTMATVSKAVQDAGDSVQGLYNVRKFIGDLLSGKAGGDTSAAQAASRELMSVRDALDKELVSRAPSFSGYLSSFQRMSKPNNRMDIGRDLMDRKSGSAVPDPVLGVQRLTPAAFSGKARDLDAVAARATGFAKAKAEDILSPQDISSIKAIQDDLEREYFRATAGSGGGSPTFERGQLQQKITRGVGRGALHHIPVVGRFAGDFLDHLDRSRNDRIQERLAYLVANPAEARRVLSSLSAPQKQVVSNALEALGSPMSRIAVQPFGSKQEGQ